MAHTSPPAQPHAGRRAAAPAALKLLLLTGLVMMDVGVSAAPATTAPAPLTPATPPPPSPGVGGGAPQPDAEGWRLGRATFYGAPEAVVRAYDPTRGEGSFGILSFGSCGYTDRPGGELPFARDAVAAMPDASPDYPGSCGRCYEVACLPGTVKGNNGAPIRLTTAITAATTNVTANISHTLGRVIDGDPLRPYLADINPLVPDTRGRLWGGNPGDARNEVDVICHTDVPSIRVRITDSCPCTQILSESAPGVAAGGETRRQEWCCGPLEHLDLSYWAFETLAHPVNGVMMTRFRPVDCETGAPLRVTPAVISAVVFDPARGVQPGWDWHPYDANAAQLRVKDPYRGVATCADLAPGGGLQLRCRECSRPGFQPFKGKTALAFWIRSNSSSTDPYDSSTPKGQVPRLKLFVMRDTPPPQYCAHELLLGNTTVPDRQEEGGWALFKIPLSAFGCGAPLATLDQLERFDFQNTNERDARFCLTDVRLT